jgi:hypothetical protein
MNCMDCGGSECICRFISAHEKLKQEDERLRALISEIQKVINGYCGDHCHNTYPCCQINAIIARAAGKV